MNKIEMHKGGQVIATFESSHVPQIGEWIWIDNRVDAAYHVKVVDRVFDLDQDRRRLTVRLIVE